MVSVCKGFSSDSERLIDQADQLADLTPVLNSLDRMQPVLVSAIISLALGRATTSPMEAAYRSSTVGRPELNAQYVLQD